MSPNRSAQIFIDGGVLVALVSASPPNLPAAGAQPRYEAWHAKLLAAMEAEALLVLRRRSSGSTSACLRHPQPRRSPAHQRHEGLDAELPDGRARQKIEDHYGYDKYPGNAMSFESF